jgi:pyruvate dehydrogenase E2 component (dihydrolipoamide acetyltransferase)
VATPGQTLPCGQLIAVIADGDFSDDDVTTFIETFKQAVREELDHAQAKPEPISLDINGRRLRYLELGKSAGVPVVFIHGFGGDLENWMFNQPMLATTRRTIAIDLPGHGGSDKAVGDGTPEFFATAITGLLDTLNIEAAHVIAHSFGASVAAALLQSQPSRIASVTAICPVGFGHEVNAEYTSGFIAARRRSEMAAVVQILFTNAALVTSEMAEALLRYKRLDGVGTALQTISAANFEGGSQRPVPPEIWAKLEDRLLVIWGADDKVIPSSHLNAVPGAARRSLIEDAGHMPHLEKAEQINDLITDFLSDMDK